MAVEKLSEGIRKFDADARALETLGQHRVGRGLVGSRRRRAGLSPAVRRL